MTAGPYCTWCGKNSGYPICMNQKCPGPPPITTVSVLVLNNEGSFTLSFNVPYKSSHCAKDLIKELPPIDGHTLRITDPDTVYYDGRHRSS